jgi:hypothetical protein
LNVFEVQFRYWFELKEEREIDPLLENKTEETEEKPEERLDEYGPNIQSIDGQFHALAYDFYEAIEEASNHLDSITVNYKILSAKMLDGYVINYPDSDENCRCPICRAKEEDFPNEDKIVINCAYCKKKIVLADFAWDSVPCPECGKLIQHDQLIPTGKGKWMHVVPKKNDKGDNKK